MITSFSRRFCGTIGCLSLLLVAGLAYATRPSATTSSLPDNIAQAMSDDEVAAARAIAAVRSAGPEGLAAFCAAYRDDLANLRDKPACLCTADSHERRLADTIDRIAGQRDAAQSQLYWFTDFAAAREAALRTGKPIVTLRMLGKLTDELSCANSRFFRTTLYVDEKVAAYLRNECILHWESVRPVPKITVDFGDGRRLERTITGNSAHYVLDSEGRVVDCLPGLYSPKAFLDGLTRAAAVAQRSMQIDDAQERQAMLANYHRTAQAELERAVRANPLPTRDTPRFAPVSRLDSFAAVAASVPSETRLPQPVRPPTARAAMNITVGKMVIEARMMDAVLPESLSLSQIAFERSSKFTIVSIYDPRQMTTLGTMSPPADEGPISFSKLQPATSLSDLVKANRRDVFDSAAALPDLFNGMPSGSQWTDGDALLNSVVSMSPPSPFMQPAGRWTATVPTAQQAARMTTSKTGSEMPLLNVVQPVTFSDESLLSPSRLFSWPGATVTLDRYDSPQLTVDGRVTPDALRRLTTTIEDETVLSAATERLIKSKVAAMPAEFLPGPLDEVLTTMTENLRRSIAADTALNEYEFHRRIHGWLADGGDVDLRELNDRVYAELFLTPRSDPWLGLLGVDVFSAIDAQGVIVEPHQTASR